MSGSPVLSFSSDTSSSHSSLATPPPSPAKRKPPQSLRLDPAPDEIEPFTLVGKTLVGIRRSPSHPNVVLSFSDKSSYQIRVDGYSPQFETGITKEIEFSQRCAEVFPGRGESSKLQLTVDRCAAITMKDKAFDAREREFTWEQSHQGIAFKFKERDGWYCLWAMLAECS
jgi:hypothetical protein